MDEWEVNDEAIQAEMLSLMHQPVKIGDRWVGEVEQVRVRRDTSGIMAPHSLEVTMRVESPYLKRSILTIPMGAPSIRRKTS